MKKIYQLLLVILFVSYSFAEQEVPLRKNSYGFTVGDNEGSLAITFFIDLLCPDSRTSFNEWVSVRRSVDLNQQGVKLIYQFNPLTWHYYSFKINQGCFLKIFSLFYILQNGGSQQAEKFIAYIFTNQDDFAQEKWLDKSLTQFLDEFANRIAGIIKIDKDGLRKDLNAGSKSFDTTRFHWKYTVGSHGVSGAPIFELNDVRIDGAQEYTSTDWINLIKSYKKERKHLSIDDFYASMMNP